MSDWTPAPTKNVGDEATSDDFNLIQDITFYLDRLESTVSVTNTTTETTLVSFTIPADQMGEHRRACLSMDGQITNSTGSSRNAPRFRLKLGGTTLLDVNMSTLAQLGSSATAGMWKAYAEIKQMGASNAQQTLLRGSLASGAHVNFATGSGLFRDSDAVKGKTFWGRNSSAIDMTSSRALAWTVVNGFASSSYTTTIHTATVAIL